MVSRIVSYCVCISVLVFGVFTHSMAAPDTLGDFSSLSSLQTTSSSSPGQSIYKVQPPAINASAYFLVDYNSGQILAEKNADKRLPPASLTKLMTMYIISSALDSGQIRLTDKVLISKNAWSTGGSRMFLKENAYVTVGDLIKGIVVLSGNDASVAMAEFLAGSEKDFVKMMNDQAQALGMKQTHFMDAKGWPHPNAYSTAQDMAILSIALIRDFPQYYKWYSERSFTFDQIKQNNRNRLLWSYEYADGLKTGHTNEAGFCLAASAVQNNMRLVAVVFGAPSDEVRTQSSKRLFQYGFRSFETHKLYNAGAIITKPKVWMGQSNEVPLGIKEAVILTIPKAQYKNLKAKLVVDTPLKAPVVRNETYGRLLITLDDKILAERPLIALKDVPVAGTWGRFTDKVRLGFNQFWSGDDKAV